MNAQIAYVIVLALVLVIAAVWPIVVDLWRGRFDPLNPRNLFLIYLALILGVYPIYMAVLDLPLQFLDFGSPAETRMILNALILSILGILSFQLGYNWVKYRQQYIRLAKRREFSAPRMAAVVAISILPIAYSMYAAFLSRGGLSGYLDDFVEIRYTGGGISAYLFFLTTAIPTIVGTLAFLASRRPNAAASWRYVTFGFFALGTVLAALTGFRATLVPIILTQIACYHYYVRPLNTSRAMIFMAVLIVGLGIYGKVRAEFESQIANQAEDSKSRGNPFDVFIRRSSGIELVAITKAQTDDKKEYQYFLPGIWEAATILVPRDLWPGKPLPQGLVYGRTFLDYYQFLRTGGLSEFTGGNSMTVVGYLYWQFGTIAVIIGMCVLGMFFAGSYYLFLSARHDQVVAFVFLQLYGNLPKMAEAPQETVNGYVLLAAFVGAISLFCYHRSTSVRMNSSSIIRPRAGVGSGMSRVRPEANRLAGCDQPPST